MITAKGAGSFMIIVLIRTVILYVVIIAGIRLMGKRQVGELEPSELVLALLIADLASVPMQDTGIPLLWGIIPIIALLCTASIISVLTLKSPRFRDLVCGTPSFLIRRGKVVEGELRRNRITLDELLEELRIQGVFDLSTVRYAILESNGQLSVLLNSADLPATAAQAGAQAQDKGVPTVLIADGRVLTDNLKKQGLDQVWLTRQLEARGAASPAQVLLLTVDEAGGLYYAAKEGWA